jgi:hypothetical protein
MVIKASASAEIRTLVDALHGEDDVQREAAVARLSVIGSRAVARLTDAFDQTPERPAKVAILRTLEAIADHRGGPIAERAIKEGGDVGVAAAGVLRALLTSAREQSATNALDALVAAALGGTTDQRVKQAAVEALQETPASVRNRVAEALRADPAAVNPIGPAAADALLNDAVEGRLPERPELLRDALTARAGAAPLNALRKMIDAVRAREYDAPRAQRDAWLALRGSIHHALALRGSRVAVYDLRETIESERDARRLPPSFISAVQVLGDRTCLEPLAALRDRTKAADDHLRHQLTTAYDAIAKREKTKRRLSPRP